MGILDDVLKALERIPAWKRVQALPERMDSIEQRLAQLEARLAPNGDRCPKCHEYTLQLIESHPHPVFGRVGSLEDHMECSHCGYTENRLRK